MILKRKNKNKIGIILIIICAIITIGCNCHTVNYSYCFKNHNFDFAPFSNYYGSINHNTMFIYGDQKRRDTILIIHFHDIQRFFGVIDSIYYNRPCSFFKIKKGDVFFYSERLIKLSKNDY